MQKSVWRKVPGANVLATAVSIVSITAGQAAVAQLETAEEIRLREGDALEEVRVTAQRQASSRAIERYRDSDAFSRFVASDDIGQFVDQNVAESLQRLPGINITRDQGEGRFVSIRGIAAGLSTVTVNGMRIGTPEDGSRAVPLDVIPTGSVDGIEVTKAPTPDMPGDAIGGNVDIRSASPFDRDGQQFSYRVEGSYNELSGETSPKMQVNFSDVFDGQWGVAFGINYLDRKLESDNIEAEYDEVDFLDGEAFSMIELQKRKYFVNRERLGANLNLEYRPDADTRFFANTLFSEFKDAETRQRSIFIFEDGDLVSFDGEQGRVENIEEDGFRRRIRFRTKEQDTLAFTAGGEHVLPALTIDYYAGISTTRERVLDENEGRYEYDLDPLSASYRIASGIPSFTIDDPTGSHLDNANYVLDRAVLEPKLIDDDEYNLGANLVFSDAFGVSSLTLKTGVDFRWKEKDVDVNEIELRSVPDARLDALTSRAPDYGLGDLGQGISSSRYVRFFNDNRDAFGIRPRDETEAVELALAEDFIADEDVYAGYLMGTLDLDRWRIISGVRVEQTRYSADGNQLEFSPEGDLVVTARSVDSDYTNVLPGLLLRYELDEDKVLRAAWTNTLSRPSFSDISPRASVNREDNEVDVGNPDLDPYEAVNYDLVFDWFFAPDSVLSLGVFYKDIDDYIVELTSNNVAEFAGFDVTRPTNGTEATVEGLEANLIYSFPEGMLSGFLVGANLTLLDTELKLLEREGESFQLPESADRIGNLYLGYERGPFSARVSVTYRDEFLEEVGDDSRYDIYVAEHTQLDVTASYQFSPAVTAVMELTNLTDEPLELYQGSSAYTLQFEEYGPTFSFGLKGQF